MPKNTVTKRINQYRTGRFSEAGAAEDLSATIRPDKPSMRSKVAPTAGINMLSLGDLDAPDTGLVIQDVNDNGSISFWDGGVEMLRIGDLCGNWGYTDTAFGMAMGEYGGTGATLTVDPDNGLRISTPDGRTIIDADGISFAADAGDYDTSALKWYDGTDMSALLRSVPHQLELDLLAYGTANSNLYIKSIGSDGGYTGRIKLIAEAGEAGSYDDMTVIIEATDGDSCFLEVLHQNSRLLKLYDTGDLEYAGNLTPTRNSTAYTGYIYAPLTTPATSTNWDGDAKDSDNNGTIDLSSVFSLPAGIKAVVVTLHAKNLSAAGKYCNLGPSSTYYYALSLLVHSTDNTYFAASQTVPCDANGDIYFWTDAAHGAECDVYIRIWGYYI